MLRPQRSCQSRVEPAKLLADHIAHANYNCAPTLRHLAVSAISASATKLQTATTPDLGQQLRDRPGASAHMRPFARYQWLTHETAAITSLCDKRDFVITGKATWHLLPTHNPSHRRQRDAWLFAISRILHSRSSKCVRGLAAVEDELESRP